MKSILYVSKARLVTIGVEEEVAGIVTGARDRNARNGVTGMLVFTGDHFAQVLEGGEEGVEVIMASIRQDPRHHSLREYVQPIAHRSFAAWSLGYEGHSTYVDRLVRSLIPTAPDEDPIEALAELRELMLLLANHSVGS